MKHERELFSIPHEVAFVSETLKMAGYEGYLVGGCVRDLLIEKAPKDWDFTTNATPEQIIALFPKTFYENKFGTVGVVNEETTDETLKVVEITPYRIEGIYTDNRRPDNVTFSTKIDDDLKRRDFTINAIAMDIEKVGEKYKGHIIDQYKGQEDILSRTIRTVGKPQDRFAEDALRILRAVRLSAELGFEIEKETEDAIKKTAPTLANIAKERIRDEFVRILMSSQPMKAIEKASDLGILKEIIPELEEGKGVTQTQAHSYDVWEHLLRSLQCSADKGWPLHIRISALLHDISKPETRRFSRETNQNTFYGHEVVGSRVTKKILERLRFSGEMIEKVAKLVRWHMFFTDTETITLSAVRRMVANVGKDNIWDLMNVRICDRVGTGRPKEDPYRLRKYKSMIEEALRDPISVGMLKIDGKKIMEVTHTPPGPKVGFILNALLEEVLEDPKKNTEEWLTEQAVAFNKLSLEELKNKAEAGKVKKDEEEEKVLKEIRKKHSVR